MNELHIGLIVIGLVVVAIVYGYNQLQEWRYQKKARSVFSQEPPDVLIKDAKNSGREDKKDLRIEPMVDERDAVSHPQAPSVPMDAPIELVIPRESLPPETPPPSSPEPALRIPMPEPERPKKVPPPQVVPLPARESSANAEPPPIAIVPDPRIADSSSARLDIDDQQVLIQSMLDPLLDYISELRFPAPIFLDKLALPEVSKRVQLIGKTDSGRWQVCDSAHPVRYSELRTGIQLVDRQGVIAEPELLSFCGAISSFAADSRASIAFPDLRQQLSAARDLDHFCAEVDMLIGLSIRAASPFSGNTLASFAEKRGLELAADGRFHFLSDSGNSLFTLGLPDERRLEARTLPTLSLERVTLLFDVPRVAGGLQVFDRAIGFICAFAEEVGGELVDDNQRVLTEKGLASIHGQLQHIYGRMDDRGIAPGSVAALRLFA